MPCFFICTGAHRENSCYRSMRPARRVGKILFPTRLLERKMSDNILCKKDAELFSRILFENADRGCYIPFWKIGGREKKRQQIQEIQFDYYRGYEIIRRKKAAVSINTNRIKQIRKNSLIYGCFFDA